VGRRIRQEVLKSLRAEYGGQIVSSLATQLSVRYGRSFEARNLCRMMQFSEQFPDFEIVSPLATQLSWSHIIEVLPLKVQEARIFYLKEAAAAQLGKRALRQIIARKAFERKEIANAQLTSASAIPLGTFKDPYLLDMLGLQDGYLETDLEAAILRELESFILELGKGFAFVDRQKRMIVDGEDFYLDLLFYHRGLKRLVAVELKLGKFEAEHKGQMELYLAWLDRYERQKGENAPIGLILCAEKSYEQIELLKLDKDGIMVAEYWAAFPEKRVFEQKIHTLFMSAREQVALRKSLLKNGS
jgi:predicted nuclease of restriction endonuclease-like (RecB) superfamily